MSCTSDNYPSLPAKCDPTCLIRSGVRATQHGPPTAAFAPHLGAPEWAQLRKLSGWKLCVLLAVRASQLLRLLGQLRGSDRTYQCCQPHHRQQPLATGVLRSTLKRLKFPPSIHTYAWFIEYRDSRSSLCDLGSVIAVTLTKIALAYQICHLFLFVYSDGSLAKFKMRQTSDKRADGCMDVG